jgi:hypothetical protein
MPSAKTKDPVDVAELLKDMLIVQLALAGVQQRAIRDIVGCDMNRVSRIARHLKPKKTNTEE